MKGNKILCYFLVFLVAYLFTVTMLSVYNSKKQIVETFVTAAANEGPSYEKCRNWRPECEQWAKEGECDGTHKVYMGKWCKKACKLCEDKMIEILKDYVNTQMASLQMKEEERDEISKELLNKLASEGEDYNYSSDYTTFHDNYEATLKNLLEEKFNLDRDNLDGGLVEVEKEVLRKRIEDIRKKAGFVNESRKQYGAYDAKSIKNLHDGTKINVKELTVNNNHTGKYLLSVNDNNGRAQCLKYDHTGTGGPTLTTAECEFSNDNNRQFKIYDINDDTEYNSHILEVNPNSKSPVTASDNLNYPFKIVSPSENIGHCVKLDKDVLSVVPCRGVGVDGEKQRFKFSNPVQDNVCNNS